MRKNTKMKYLAISCLSIGMIISSFITIHAASVSVSASDNGDGSYTVYVSPSSSNIAGGVTVNTSDGQSAEVWCEGGSCSSVQFKGTGTVSIEAKPSTFTNMDNPEAGDISVSKGNTSVYVSKPEQNNNNGGGTQTPTTPTTPQTPQKEEPKESKPEEKKEEKKDSNSKLSSLSISTGTLSPAFKASTTSYTVNLPAGTTSIKIDAKANKSTSILDGTGEHKLKTGKNIIEISCIAEDGSYTVYNITVVVSEKPLTYMNFGAKKLGVVSGNVKVSKLFTSTKLKVDGVEVDAWKNDALNITLLYMQDEATSEKNLYMYDEATKSVTSIYKPFAFAGRNLVQIDVPKELQKREGMTFTTVKVGKTELPGWKFNDQNFANYALIYVMDDKGNKVYYQYEAAEQSLQIYSGAAAITQKAYDDYVKSTDATLKKQKYIMYGLGGLAAVLVLIIVLLLIFRRKKTTKYQKVDIQGKSNTPKFHIEAEALTSIDDEE